jgi:hypothetical protein
MGVFDFLKSGLKDRTKILAQKPPKLPMFYKSEPLWQNNPQARHAHKMTDSENTAHEGVTLGQLQKLLDERDEKLKKYIEAMMDLFKNPVDS